VSVGRPTHAILKDIERFSRLFLVKDIGIAGIRRLRDSKAVIVGCGATGTHIAELLIRMGFGEVSLIDKDYVDISNIYRTSLFTEDDVRKALPKAIACANALRRIDSSVKVRPHVMKLTPANAEELLKGHDIIIDGTDNYVTRLIINDFSVKHRVPWVLTGVGTWYGNVWLIDPARGTPCMRCVYGDVRDEGVGNVCDVLGVVPTAVALVASIAATLALKYVLGQSSDELTSTYFVIDAKRLSIDALRVVRRRDCPVCGEHRFEYLGKHYAEEPAKPICGTKAVEINPSERLRVSFEEIVSRIGKDRVAGISDYTLKIRVGKDIHIIVFNDGRAIVNGVTDPERALRIYEEVTGLRPTRHARQ
jgi:adenylyltransferase/sulfurtransferase